MPSLLMLLIATALGAASIAADPWQYRCDNPFINVVHRAFAYDVLAPTYANHDGPKPSSFIVSLCNLTNYTPMQTPSPCKESAQYFVAAWNSSGQCLETYDVAMPVSGGNGSTSTDPLTFVFRSMATNHTISLFASCNTSAMNTTTVNEVDQLTPTQLMVGIQSSSLCSAPSPTDNSSSDSTGSAGGPSGHHVGALIPLLFVVAVLGVIIMAIVFRRHQRKTNEMVYEPVSSVEVPETAVN